MTLTYVLRSMRRRKVRAALMVLALIVGVGALTALNATVDSYRRHYAGTVAGEVGAFDLAISRRDTEANPFLDYPRLEPAIRSVAGVAEVAGRLEGVTVLRHGERTGDVLMVALEASRDRFGALEVITGSLDLGFGPEGLHETELSVLLGVEVRMGEEAHVVNRDAELDAWHVRRGIGGTVEEVDWSQEVARARPLPRPSTLQLLEAAVQVVDAEVALLGPEGVPIVGWVAEPEEGVQDKPVGGLDACEGSHEPIHEPAHPAGLSQGSGYVDADRVH